MICANVLCKRSFTREHSWHRIERGVTLFAGTVPRDLDYCCIECVRAAHPGPRPDHRT